MLLVDRQSALRSGRNFRVVIRRKQRATQRNVDQCAAQLKFACVDR
jgi:hypothetical protein